MIQEAPFQLPTFQVETPNYSGRTFLVVEDTQSNKALIHTFLSKTGAHLIHASNGLEALEAIENHPHIELVLMDIRLPLMNGYTATRMIKKMKPDLPVIAQTAYAMESDRLACLEAGCDEFLVKPFKKSELIMMVNKFLNNLIASK